MKNNDFFDEDSKIVYNQLPKTNSSVRSRVMLDIERFEIGQSYVTAKVRNRYGEDVIINIQGGRPGIEIQESLFKLKERKSIICILDNKVDTKYQDTSQETSGCRIERLATNL